MTQVIALTELLFEPGDAERVDFDFEPILRSGDIIDTVVSVEQSAIVGFSQPDITLGTPVSNGQFKAQVQLTVADAAVAARGKITAKITTIGGAKRSLSGIVVILDL